MRITWKHAVVALLVAGVLSTSCLTIAIGVAYHREWIDQKWSALSTAWQDAPVAPDAPDTPDTPDAPDTPDTPDAANTPVYQHPIVVLTPPGQGLDDLPGVTGKELAELFDTYSGGISIVHTWDAFAANTKANADSRQPGHGHMWSGTCEGAVFHRGGVNQTLQGQGSDFWIVECSTGNPSALWAVWVPWAP